MSLNVLIVAEDYRKDEYILKPIVTSMLEEVGKPRANVRVCRNPMIERGTLERTHPKAPSSPNQKYRAPSSGAEE
jgi:hypothetical protein